MVQALSGRAREVAGHWGVAVVEAEWVATVPAQVLVEIVYVLVVEQGFRTKQAFLAMI